MYPITLIRLANIPKTEIMKPLETYKGKEQTYFKHIVLEHYLEKVAFNIGSFLADFVYIDGFSGPWRSCDPELGDTSFVIAMDTLRKVRETLRERGKTFNVRWIFIEDDPEKFSELEEKVQTISDMEVLTLNKKFENAIPEILDFSGEAFSLTFIDPTGWTGYGLQKIKPLLKSKGEILINFMINDINRFFKSERADNESLNESLSDLFGGDGRVEEFQTAIKNGFSREEAIVEVYKSRLKIAGCFDFVISTRILNPNEDRTYFHLIYATRHLKGLLEFRKVEQRLYSVQNKVRSTLKQFREFEKIHQYSLFNGDDRFHPRTILESDKSEKLKVAYNILEELISSQSTIAYDSILGHLLEIRLVWEKDIKDRLSDMQKKGMIRFERLNPKERSLKWGNGHKIVRI